MLQMSAAITILLKEPLIELWYLFWTEKAHLWILRPPSYKYPTLPSAAEGVQHLIESYSFHAGTVFPK